MDAPAVLAPLLTASIEKAKHASMFDDRNLKIDLFALGLLAVVVFLGLALLTYDPADPIGELIPPLNSLYQPDRLVYPPNETVQNACGHWGALAADMMLTGVGLGAYYLVFSLAIVDIHLLRRREIDTPMLRGVGWIGSLVGFTTLATTLVPGLSPGPVIGSGGYLGAIGSGILDIHFATAGGLILTSALLIGGLLLCTDYTMLRLAQLIVTGLIAIRLLPQRLPKKKKKKRAKSDLEENAIDSEEDEPQPAIKISGKRVAERAVVDDDLEDEEEVEAADEEQEDEVEEEQPEEESPVVVKAKKKTKKQKKQPAKAPHFNLIGKKEKDVEREKVMTQLSEADPDHKEQPCDFELPDINLLVEGEDIAFDDQEVEVRRKAKILEKTFAEFGFKVKVVEIETGPVIAQYEVQLEAGLRLSKITGLADDLAIALRVPSVRIVAPIPGKNTVGIEVPNETRQVVRLREVMEEAGPKLKKMRIPLFLGKDVSGNPLISDLSTLPHLLIAGRTGTGKSVCLNAIISSILMTKTPDEVRMLMIDPKMVELSGYGRLPHLMHPVVTDMKKAEAILAWAVDKMEERYALLAQAGVRHITSYNQLGEEELFERLQPETDEDKESIPLHLPFIVIVADEMADLMMTAGKEVEQHIIRLAQKSRAVGIHLILATQKPTVDVITGLIKSNLPARISFQVASRTDSRVVLDENGADKLLGNGDMLFLWPGTSTLLRGQGTYLGDDEIEAITEAVSTGEQYFVKELVNIKVEEPEGDKLGELKNRDDLYESAVEIVVREGRGSVSLLQRSLGIGYGRAARLIDFMAEDGIVGPYAGSQAREVLLTSSDLENLQNHDAEETPPPPKRRSKVVIRDEEEESDESEWSEDEETGAECEEYSDDEYEYETA